MSEHPKACSPEFFVARYERVRRFCVRALPIAAGLAVVATVAGVLLRLLNSSRSAALDWSSTLLVAGFDFAVLALYLTLRRDAAARIVAELRGFTPLPPRVFPPEEPVGFESKGLPLWLRWFLFAVLPCIGFGLLPPADWISKAAILAAVALLAYWGWSTSEPYGFHVSRDGIRLKFGSREETAGFDRLKRVTLTGSVGSPALALHFDAGRSAVIPATDELLGEIAERLRAGATAAGRDTSDWPNRSTFVHRLTPYLQAAKPFEKSAPRVMAAASAISFGALLGGYRILNRILLPHGGEATVYGPDAAVLAVPALLGALLLGTALAAEHMARRRQPHEVFGLLVQSTPDTTYRVVSILGVAVAFALMLLTSVAVTPAFVSFDKTTLVVRGHRMRRPSLYRFADLTTVRRVEPDGRTATHLCFVGAGCITPAVEMIGLHPDADLRLCEVAWAATGKPPADSPCRPTK